MLVTSCHVPVHAANQDHLDGPSFVGDGPCHAVSTSEMPLTESLQDTVKRLLPLWHDTIAPAVKSGQKVLIVAHGNSIRVRACLSKTEAKSHVIKSGGHHSQSMLTDCWTS